MHRTTANGAIASTAVLAAPVAGVQVRDAFLHGAFWNQASNVYSFTPCWGDDEGTPIEEDVLEHLNAAMWHVARAFQWSVGDVMCVDNERAMHARTSFTGPRSIVVAFSKV